MESKRTKIVIVFASIGTGHEMASLGIKQGLEEKIPFAKISSFDLLETLDSVAYQTLHYGYPLRRTIRDFAIGYIYDWFWRSEIFIPGEKKLGHLFGLFGKKFKERLEKENPPIVISVHPLASLLLSFFKKQGYFQRIFHLAVDTDFFISAHWPLSGVNIYALASENSKNKLVERGVEEKKIKITGIPLRKGFWQAPTKKELTQKYLEEKFFRILILAGSSRPGLYYRLAPYVRTIVKKIKKLPFPVECNIIAGTNEELKSFVLKKKSEIQTNDKIINVFGFVKNLAPLIKNSHLVISKSGGLICAEALSQNVPLVFVSSVFGQEKENMKYLCQYKTAFRVRKKQRLLDLLYHLGKNRKEVLEKAENCYLISKPKSSLKIVQITKNYLNKN